jgi:hypothetical protein
MTRTLAHGLWTRMLRSAWRRQGPESVELALERNEACSFPARRRRLEVECLSGCVLLTVEGDPDDHVLSPGMRFASTRRGRLALMAFGSCRVRVAAAFWAPACRGAQPPSVAWEGGIARGASR